MGSNADQWMKYLHPHLPQIDPAPKWHYIKSYQSTFRFHHCNDEIIFVIDSMIKQKCPRNRSSVERRLTATSVSVIQSPCYYSHFLWRPGKMAIPFLVKNPSYGHLLIQPKFFGLFMTVLMGFHCTNKKIWIILRKQNGLTEVQKSDLFGRVEGWRSIWETWPLNNPGVGV